MTENLSQLLINWYTSQHRDLPWRNTSDPYKIWLSEIILQQTRVNQGLPYYQKFIERYPTVFELASAPEDEVLRLWQGLGYYSRARNLHACAKTIVDEYQGIFPESYQQLLKLKGVGKYTAAAIASFAFNISVPVVDGNVFRVLSRYFNIEDDISQAKTFGTFFNIASDLIPKDRGAEFNQAMMELGALICKPTNPNCDECPINLECEARILGKQTELPVKKKKIKVKKRYFYYLIWEKDSKLAMKKRGPKDIWQGLFDFDSLESAEPLTLDEIETEIHEKYGEAEIQEITAPVTHILSHQKIEAVFIHLQFSELNQVADSKLKYYSIDEVEDLPKPRLIEKYLTSKNI